MNKVTKKEVFNLAQVLAAKNYALTTANIREHLGDRGSRTTLHKYLTQWKELCYKSGTDKGSAKSSQEISDLEEIINKQQEQIETISHEFIQLENNHGELKETLEQTEVTAKSLGERNTILEVENQKLAELYASMVKEREATISQVLEDKNQMINSLREELAEVYKISIESIRQTDPRGHEALMQEKVKVINLEEKLRSLGIMQGHSVELVKTQQENVRLKKELARNERLLKNQETTK